MIVSLVIGWFLEFYVLAISKVIAAEVPVCIDGNFIGLPHRERGLLLR